MVWIDSAGLDEHEVPGHLGEVERLLLILIVMAIYLIEAVFIAPDSTQEARTVATQPLATVGTLVAAVAAFYFGTGTMTRGAAAATQATTVAAGRPEPPTAITKGSTPADEGYELVGVLNRRGRDTRSCFEYGPTDA